MQANPRPQNYGQQGLGAPQLQTNPRPQNYGQLGMGPPSFPRSQYKCFYCDSIEHTSLFCTKLTEDIGNKLVFKQGFNYFYPNREIIPRDTGKSVMELVHEFSENSSPEKKPNVAYMEPEEEQQEPTAAIISTNRWEMWSPLEMHYGNEDEENLTGFGLQRSARTGDKEKAKAPDQQPQTQPATPKPPPGNQEANKIPPEPRKRRLSYPGAWVEGISDVGSSDDESSEPAKDKGKQPEKKAEAELEITRPVDKSKVGGGLKKKILKQSFTLTLEELLLIAPKFLQELQDLTDEDNRPANQSQNSGRCNHGDFVEDNFENQRKETPESIQRSLTYACPLGFIDISIEGRKVRALVDTGAEMNIMSESLAIQLKLPLREISMNITGIGGHSTRIVGLAEGIQFNIDSEDECEIPRQRGTHKAESTKAYVIRAVEVHLNLDRSILPSLVASGLAFLRT
ncbi:hypothetical protein H4Q26_006480, partial [Puccinia striiformis f. sp. tritici PST-130]